MTAADAIADDLRRTVEAGSARLLELEPERVTRPRAAGKWSPLEVLGHLVDSACNNHRRFVLARIQGELEFPGYDENAWVEVQSWRRAEWQDLVELWRTYNLHLARLIAETPQEELDRPHARHTLDRIAWRTLPAGRPATLGYLMRDYVGHLRHHLAQALCPPAP